MHDHQPQPRRQSGVLPIILARLALASLLGLVVVAGLVLRGTIEVPNHFNPFTPLRISDEMNWLTRLKLSRLERNAPQCLAVLSQSPVSYRPLSDQETGQGCGYSNAVDVARTSVGFNRAFTATCPLTVAWALFEAHVLQPAAQRHLGQNVMRVTHLGTYACRNINHRASGRRSEHATANAIDISGFVLADGRQITVKSDWAGDDPRRSAFLRAVRDGACGVFDVVLSPAYNEAHHDHLHLDMGSYRACR